MPNPSLPRLVRSVLEGAPDALPLNDLLTTVDDFVLDCTEAEDPESLVLQFEEELQSIHHEVVDYSCVAQTEVFLAVLYHLAPVLPSTSVISWFDLVLRPALREPKLATQAVNHAKELIISALQKTHEANLEKIGDFRRRLLELYLLDAYNEGSGDDVLEWAELTSEEREKRTHWKHNLEDILVKFGNERPEDLLNEIDRHFMNPSARLQLFSLLNIFSCAPNFSSAAQILPRLPLMEHLLLSLFLDNSSTACTLAVTLIVKLLPFFAVYAREALKEMLPRLFAILARIMCWKRRRASKGRTLTDEAVDPDFEKELEQETNPILTVSPNVEWERLDMVFNVTTPMPPSSRPFFTMLYYLYPSNVLKFLRSPVHYLNDNNIPSPYLETWEQALNEDEIRRRTENLVREHSCHPLLVWRDAIVEMSGPEFWQQYGLARIVSEAAMLDIRNLAVGLQERYAAGNREPSLQPWPTSNPAPPQQEEDTPEAPPPRFLQPVDLSSGKVVISLQDMVDTTVALKSNLEVEIVHPTAQWPSSLFSDAPLPTPDDDTKSPMSVLEEDPNALHIAQAISGLQREVLLLRNDLNFELWLSRENSKHIARLYQDRILMKTAEAERQGLYNKLRKYRAEVVRLEGELQEHKRQASNAKNKYADWNAELQKKLKELREEKKNWQSEAAALRTAEKEGQAHFAAQGKLLGDALKQVFDLETQWKENQHKIDRLKDYERQIDQHLKIQSMWNEDFAKFNDRENDILLMQNQYKQMELQVASMAKALEDSEDLARHQRRQIQTLEAQLTQIKQRKSSAGLAESLASFQAEKAALQAANAKLRDENTELKFEIEERAAMVEVLKGQISQQGLVSEPRNSPILSAFA